MSEIKKIGNLNIVKAILLESISSPESPLHTCVYKEIRILMKDVSSHTGAINMSHVKYTPEYKQYIPKKGDKLFFHKGCTVLREKVRAFGQEKDISVTIKQENANIEFISKTSIDSYLDSLSHTTYFIKKNDFCKFIELNYPGQFDYLREDIMRSELEHVLVAGDMPYNKAYMFLVTSGGNWNNTNIEKNNISLGVKVLMNQINPNGSDINCSISANNSRIITEENYQIVSNMLTSGNIYMQDEINRLINSESIVVDQQMYEQLEAMLISGQESDAQLAMEIIANSNLEKSIGRIMFLLKYHYDKVCQYKCCKHVNFKSLISYIGCLPAYLSVDKIIDILISKNLMTEEYFIDLLPIIKEDVQKHINFGSGSRHFRVSKITCSEELLTTMGKKG